MDDTDTQARVRRTGRRPTARRCAAGTFIVFTLLEVLPHLCLLGARKTLASTHDVERSELDEGRYSTQHRGLGQPEDTVRAAAPRAGVRTESHHAVVLQDPRSTSQEGFERNPITCTRPRGHKWNARGLLRGASGIFVTSSNELG